MAAAPADLKPFNVQQFKNKLIEEVKKRPMLYNSDEPAYKDKNAVEDAWNEVVDVLDPECKHDLTIDFAKKHWKALRDDFFRRNKKLENNEISREKVMKWPLFPVLEFLRAHYKRPSKSGVPVQQAPVVAAPVPVKMEVVIQKPTDSPPKTGAAKRKASVKSGLKKRKKIKLEKVDNWSEDLLSEQELDATNNNVSATKPVEEASPVKDDKRPMTFDEEEHYARAIAATLRRLRPKVRALAKARIQQLLFDLEFGSLDSQKSNGSGHHTSTSLHMYASNE